MRKGQVGHYQPATREDDEIHWELAECENHPTPDIFYADDQPSKLGYQIVEAKKICRSCPIRTDCLQYAMSRPKSDDWGIWGALSSRERNVLREKQRQLRRAS